MSLLDTSGPCWFLEDGVVLFGENGSVGPVTPGGGGRIQFCKPKYKSTGHVIGYIAFRLELPVDFCEEGRAATFILSILYSTLQML